MEQCTGKPGRKPVRVLTNTVLSENGGRRKIQESGEDSQSEPNVELRRVDNKDEKRKFEIKEVGLKLKVQGEVIEEKKGD